jgi:hypothetical protein
MFNCCILKKDGLIVGIFSSASDAEFIRNRYIEWDTERGYVSVFTIDWAFIENLPF